MPGPFRHHNLLRLFAEIGRYSSFSEAAGALNMTKGAISYQIRTLERDLNLPLFERNVRGVALTSEGHRLRTACQAHYDAIEAELTTLRSSGAKTLTVGVSTYFAARWLSPLLMSFMQAHPEIQLRLQPLVQFSQAEMQAVDLAIRWGDGDWEDVTVAPFMPMPAFPVGNRAAMDRVRTVGLQEAMRGFTLLRDRDDSSAWTDWFMVAGLPDQMRVDALIVPDPNVRVQAVIDGQGIALMDRLVASEQGDGKLFRLSETELSDYGYFLATPRRATPAATVTMFAEWLLSNA